MTLILILAWCVYGSLLVAAIYFTQATTRRVLGALAGGCAVALIGAGVEGLAHARGWWRYTSGDTPVGPLFTWLGVRFHVFGNITKGHSVQLISDGLVLPANMKRSHISEHDLLEAARLHGVENLSKVAQAFKERSGDISVVKRE